MKAINLTINGSHSSDNLLVYIDGEKASLQRNKHQNLCCSHQTEKDKVKIQVYKLLDVGGFWWFLTQIFFFLISIFGIFDIHARKQYISYEHDFEVDLTQDCNIVLRSGSNQINSKAFAIQSNCPAYEISNRVFANQKAKKIYKALRITKVLLALAVVATIILVFFKVVIGM